MWRAAWIAITLTPILSLVGCGPAESNSIDTLVVNEGPIRVEYGPQQQFQGVWLSEFEGSAFNYCPPDATGCPNMLFDNWGCWLEFSEAARDQLHSSLAGQPEPYEVEGVFTLNFTGRETLRRGSYGHLGVSSCQVLVESLDSVRPFEPDRPDMRMTRLLADTNRNVAQ
ncbi:MAG: hypothetical protein ACTS1Z_03705 [Parasphingopyxis sp.]|uniref:hypothetical protein n=1 Tax=Parasphingopyxis sp. TaxID=1920299 RepID=UPI003FA045E1